MPAQEYRRGGDIAFLGDLHNMFVLYQRAASASQRTVSCNMNPFVLAEIHYYLLWQSKMVFDLIDGWDNCGMWQQTSRKRTL